MSATHPVNDKGPDFLLDPGTMANVVSSIIRVLLALVGPDKAKESIDFEVASQIKAAVEAGNVATDLAADEIERSRFGG